MGTVDDRGKPSGGARLGPDTRRLLGRWTTCTQAHLTSFRSLQLRVQARPAGFRRRVPAGESRWRICSPEEAWTGADPVQDARWLRSGKRRTSPTSARMRAAPAGPTAGRSITCDPLASIACFGSALSSFGRTSSRTRSASWSAAIL
jgi:hypothetical protein